MERFAELWTRLDESTRTRDKVRALRDFFAAAPPSDAAWAFALLTGRRPPTPVPRARLRQWAREAAGVSEWLFDECYAAVGDLGETLTLILPDPLPAPPPHGSGSPAAPEGDVAVWMEWAAGLAGRDEADQRAAIWAAWSGLDRRGRFLLHKLIGGAFRVGVSRETVVRGLAEATGLPAPVLAHRSMGAWSPSAAFYDALTAPVDAAAPLPSQPYPFCLAHPIGGEPSGEIGASGEPADWLIEWKWDGIRAQVIRREGRTYVWSRGEELIGDTFPEVAAAGDALPDGTVLDGEILAWAGDGPAPFAELQRRLNRKSPGRKLLAEVTCRFVAFDALEWDGRDQRSRPLAERRAALVRLTEDVPALTVSPAVPAADWAAVAAARADSEAHRAEGLMLKRWDSPYEGGRRRGLWWKWKREPITVDAVLVAAQRGTGKRASLYTDYTFALWDGDRLVTFAKAYSGLSDAEIREVDRWVRAHVREKFGPVRTVDPELVFELAFEGIQRSTRHKSGVAVRFPRIARWRRDKRADQADTLDAIRARLP